MPAGAPPQHSPVWPLWTGPSPIPKRRFMILPKTRKVRRLTPPPCSGFSRGFRSPYGRAAPHTHQPPSGNSQKTASPQFHILQVHTLLPCLTDPHAPRIHIRAISPYHHSLTMCPPRPARPASTNLRANRPRKPIATAASPPAASTHGAASRRGVGVDAVGARAQAGPKACACGPGRGSPKNLDRLDSTKVRRCGAGSRRTDGRSRRPSARPGVTLAPGFAVYTLSRIS